MACPEVSRTVLVSIDEQIHAFVSKPASSNGATNPSMMSVSDGRIIMSCCHDFSGFRRREYIGQVDR